MKLFVAVDPDPQISKSIHEFFRKSSFLAEGTYRLIPERNYHLTLKFLGEVSEGQRDSIQKALRAIADHTTEFDLSFSGVGGFPDALHPEVVWVGVKDPAKDLETLSKSIENQMAMIGFPKETRDSIPHLTVARALGQPPQLDGLEAITPEFGTCKIREMALVESQPTQVGVEYRALDRFVFQKSVD